MKPIAPNSDFLTRSLQDSLDRRRTNSTLRSFTLPNSSQIDFSSNDFLSLSKNPLLRSAFLQELRESSSSGLASGGSRLLDGNSAYAEELEGDIAKFHGAEAGLLFNSGFDANAGFFACVPQKGDVIVYDELIHASVHDGMRLSRAAQKVSFPHNDPDGLKDVLLQLVAQDEGQASRNVIVAAEAIYSMDGDVAPLREIVDVVDQVVGAGRGYIVVDEAHSTGVLGPQGRGLVCELGLEDRIFARLHTFGKALAANGAIILGSPTLRHYLVNYARPLIYTTFLSYPSLALIRSSYTLLWSDKTAALQEHVHTLTGTMYAALLELQRTSLAARQLLQIPKNGARSTIVSIQLTDPRSLASHLQDRAMNVRPVVFPTVPLGTQRIRVCLHAGNMADEVEKLVRSLAEWCEEMKQRGGDSEAKLSVEARL